MANLTTVELINWKESFLSRPLIIVNAIEPIKYRIACADMSDNGENLTIVPSLTGTIDDMLEVLEGCLKKESNFRLVLKEYYGDKAENLRKFECDFNGINVAISEEMSAWDAKLKWLRDALNAGYQSVAVHLTTKERVELEKDTAMKEIIRRYRER